jgi:transposase InsO family protein
MPWKTMDVEDQRVRFVVEALTGRKPVSHVCAAFGISRPTGYLWLERYRVSGIAGICERSRRPLHSPEKTSVALEEQIVALRQCYPDWGARKLAVLLARQGIQLPSSTIHRILLRRGLVREADRHRPAVQRFERARPNELWQMDFKGPKAWPEAMGPLSVIDDHSRYVIALQRMGSPDGGQVKTHLTAAFEQCGLPEAMLMDHGTPWWNWQSFSGRTHLSLWLMRQGIRLYWSGIRHPQTQGKVERFHGSLERALQHRGTPQQEIQAWLDGFRREHNYVRPHEALGMKTPSEFWLPSPRCYIPNPPAWEYPEGAWTLKVDCQGTIDIKDHRWRIGKTLAGERVHIQPVEERFLVYYCNTLVRELDPVLSRSTIVERLSTEEQKNSSKV